jgi:hypothetical protein
MIVYPFLGKSAGATQYNIVFPEAQPFQGLNPDHEAVVGNLFMDLGLDLIPGRWHVSTLEDADAVCG